MIIFFFFLLKIQNKQMKCRNDFINGYGLDGEEYMVYERMMFCPSVKFSCCSPFDEMKFHKNWY